MSEFNIGPAEGTGPTRHATYVGHATRLKGRGALIRDGMNRGPGQVVAQFDDYETGLAFGWWAFAASEFEEDKT
jgi:hypothetical protein